MAQPDNIAVGSAAIKPAEAGCARNRRFVVYRLPVFGRYRPAGEYERRPPSAAARSPNPGEKFAGRRAKAARRESELRRAPARRGEW